MKKNLSTKKKSFFIIIPVLGVVLILGIVLTAFIASNYYTKSKEELSAGLEAFDAKDWQTAWQHANRLTGWFAFSPVSVSEEAKTLNDQSSLLTYGSNSREQKDYANALLAYDTYLQLYPESAENFQIQTILSELYIEWGQQLQENNQPDLAYQKYQTVLKEFSDTPAANNAVKAIPAALIEWSAVLQKEQQADQAQKLLAKIMVDYPDSDEAVQAHLQIANSYALTGQQYLEEKSFLLALQAFSNAKQYIPGNEANPMVDEGYQTALLKLSNDTGAEGLQIIAETVNSVCDDKRTTSPAVGISKDQPAKGMLCMGSNFDFPKEWQATTPGNLKYLVRVYSTYTDGEICFYSSDGSFSPGMGAHELIVRNEEVTVRVLNAESGGMIDSMTFTSTSNYSCPSKRAFSSMTEYTSGGNVDPDIILNWLKKYFE